MIELKNLKKEIGISETTIRTYASRPEVGSLFKNRGDRLSRWKLPNANIFAFIGCLPQKTQKRAFNFIKKQYELHLQTL